MLSDTWDDQLLVVELTELMVEALDLPIELTQFGLVEIDNYLQAQVSNEDAGQVDDGEPISRLGELFQLGQHRLLCGDSPIVAMMESPTPIRTADGKVQTISTAEALACKLRELGLTGQLSAIIKAFELYFKA